MLHRISIAKKDELRQNWWLYLALAGNQPLLPHSKLLFDAQSEQLLKFHEVLGPIPTAILEMSPKRQKLYTYVNKTCALCPTSRIMNQCRRFCLPANKFDISIFIYTYIFIDF